MRRLPESREDLLYDLSQRAVSYVPEWRCDLLYSNADAAVDAGDAFMLLWADMFCGTMERYRLLPENYRRVLLDALGSEPKPPLPARSYLAFTPLTDVTQPISVPAKTGVASSENPEAVFETDRDLPLSQAVINALYPVFPSQDIVRRVERRDIASLFKNESADPHIWTLRHGYALDVRGGASLRLAIKLRGGELSMLCENANWEFLDGGCLKPLTVRESGGMLLIIFPDHKENPCRELRFSLHGGDYSKAVLCSISAYPCGYALKADVIYAGDTQQTGNTFYPFGERFLPGSCFYIACEDALNKYGAEIELSFDLSFKSFPIEGSPEPYIHYKKLMKASDLTPPEEFTIAAAKVAWEYYNGVGWASLPLADSSAGDMFADIRTRSCTISFICPQDIQSAVFGAHETMFIRARILAVDNMFRMYGSYQTPVISKPGFRYQYPNGVPVTHLEVTEHLDTRKVELISPAKLFGALPAPSAIYFAFAHPFEQGTLLFVLARGEQRVHLQWEYLADTWQLLDIHDGTGGFAKTGIVTYQTFKPCEKKKLFGHEAHWMRLADMAGNLSYSADSWPTILDIYENVVTATARTPGEASNLPSGAFTSLTMPVEGVLEVVNPLPSVGGTAEETEDKIISRLTSSFFHHDRAIASCDYEQLAKAASPRVFKAKCYPNTGISGSYASGHTCMVLLCKDAAQDDFETLSLEVRRYLDLRRPLASGVLHIIKPVNIEIGVTVYAEIARPDEALTVKLAVKNALIQFLDPVNGGLGENGWEIGALPSYEKIFSFLRTIPDILRLSEISVTYSYCGIPVDYRLASCKPFVVPVSGTHKILLKAEGIFNATKEAY